MHMTQAMIYCGPEPGSPYAKSAHKRGAITGRQSSERRQLGQRYVAVKPEACAVPPLSGAAKTVYLEGIEAQIEAYQRLVELLTPLAEPAYFRRFPHRPRSKATELQVWRKALEIARYVLPVAMFAYLYHTVSTLTLLRYWRLCQGPGAPLETRTVVGQMVADDLKRGIVFRTPLAPTPGKA